MEDARISRLMCDGIYIIVWKRTALQPNLETEVRFVYVQETLMDISLSVTNTGAPREFGCPAAVRSSFANSAKTWPISSK